MRLERTRRVSEFVDDDYDDSIVWQQRQELHGSTIFKKKIMQVHIFVHLITFFHSNDFILVRLNSNQI